LVFLHQNNVKYNKFFMKSVSKKIFITAILLFVVVYVKAQGGVSINMSGAAPDNSSLLDVSSNDKGVLIPRMTEAEKLAVTSPATGLAIYQTDGNSGFWYYDGAIWKPVSSSSGGGVNAGTNPGDMIYWDGTQWSPLAVGLPGQHLILSAAGLPLWAGPTYPSVITEVFMPYIGATLAEAAGEVLNDGGSPVISRGLCWSTNPNPTLADYYVECGTGVGNFTGFMSNLQLGTQYFFRAYATNAVGTSYGLESSFTTVAVPLIAIGEFYQGGYIFYIDGSGTGGLIAAPFDQSSAAQWGCEGSMFNITNTALGSGQSNTSQIISNCTTPGIAAEICNNLSLNSYSDWFLPSRDELDAMYQNLKLSNIGGFSDGYYWTSTEVHAWSTWFVYFYDGFVDWNTKSTQFYVRAVRAF